MTARLDGRTALVTGAGSGIGKATALRFAADGARVACLDLDEPAAVATADELPTALAIGCDVTDEPAVAEAFQRLDDQNWTVDVLVSCAGVDRVAGDGFDEALASHTSQLTVMSRTAWSRMLAIHLDGAFLCTREVIRRLLAAQVPGSLVYISSIAGTAGWGPVHYAAAKGGLLGMTRALARELGPRGIRVNAICPGVIETPMTERLDAGMIAGLTMLTPLGRVGQAADVAAMAGFLASGDSDFVTGQALSPNGGLVIA